MFEPSSRSHTVFKDVNTGAITTSQWFAFATRGFRASAVSTDSLTVLYIFQFPAITGLRIAFLSLFATKKHKANHSASCASLWLLVRQRFDAGKFFAGKVLERCTAARRDVRDPIRHSRATHSRNRIATTNNHHRAAIRCFRNGARDADRAF